MTREIWKMMFIEASQMFAQCLFKKSVSKFEFPITTDSSKTIMSTMQKTYRI